MARHRYHYMLRRTFALWKPEETIEEVLDFCGEYGIDEVIWKIDVEEFSHGLTPLDTIRRYLPWLAKARDASASEGILFSINPWVTHNHADRGRDMRPVHPEMGFAVDWTGVESMACACSLSGAWRNWLCDAFGLYASLDPHILWVEDDIRTFNHDPVEYGCFCPRHLERFSDLVGRKVSREEVIEAILAPGPPHPWRSRWLEMMGGIMIDVVRTLEQAVHGVNPKVLLGLMCSSPSDHALEGRRWHEFTKALSGPNRPAARPCMGCYNQVLPSDLISVMDVMRETIHCLPAETRICAELENFNYSRFSKSVRFTRLQLGICALLRHGEITMNLYDHLGTPLSREPEYGAMLKEVRPRLEAVLEAEGENLALGGSGAPGIEIGVGLIHTDDGPARVHLAAGSTYRDMDPRGVGWSVPLQSLGVPVTFGPSPVVALTGQTVRALSPSRIMDLLSQGLLLDATATEALQDLGFGEHLGAALEDWYQESGHPLSAEEFMHEDFGGGPERYMTLINPTPDRRFAVLRPRQGSALVSRFVDPDRLPVLPGVVAYQNLLGGRVVQSAADLSKGIRSGFLSWNRFDQLGWVVRYLAKDKLMVQMLGGAYLYLVCWRNGSSLVLGIANLSSDDLAQISLLLHAPGCRPSPEMRLVGEDHRWKTVMADIEELRAGTSKVTLREPLKTMDFVAARVNLEGDEQRK